MKVDYKNNPKIVNDFYNYLLEVYNFSKETALLYYSSVIYFFIFIKEYKNISLPLKDFGIFIILGIEEDDILLFMLFLNSYRGNNAKTRKIKLFALKKFYNYIFIKYKSYCKDKINPCERINAPTAINKLPKTLNLEQAKKICNIFNDNNSRNYTRNNLIIKYFLNLGLRRSELINLNISNIDFENKRIKVIGKGNKERILPISDKLKNNTLEYLKTRKDVSLYSKEPLFITNTNNRLSRSTLRYIVADAYKLAGLENYNFTIHSLRHTAATMIYKQTKGDILIIKELLGHASIETTQIYTHIENEVCKNAFLSNPLANYDLERKGRREKNETI